MASSMVAKACTSTSCQMPAITIQEKASRNKRKFRADPPLIDPNKVIPLPSNECTSFEFSAEKFDAIPTHIHPNKCDMCCANQNSSDSLKLDLALSYHVGSSEVGSGLLKEHVEESLENSHDANWSDLTESQLEELVLSSLDTIFKSAIKKIIANGYSEEITTKAILRSGLWYGCKDTVSNIVDNTLACLRTGQNIDLLRDHCFDNLQQLEKYILAELVCLLREVKPFFSIGDAMWYLLISDMNVSHACGMDSDPSGSFLGSNTNPSIPEQSQLINEVKSTEYNVLVPFKSNVSETPNLTDSTNLNAKGVTSVSGKPFTASKLSQNTEKFAASKKVSGITRRDYILRQKLIHFEKHYRSKGTSRTGKLGSFGGLALDRKLKAVADSTKNPSFKITNGGAFDAPQDNPTLNISTSVGFSSVPTFGLMSNVNSSVSIPDMELSLSFPAKSVVNTIPISYNVESTNNRPLNGKWVPQNRKDEMIMKLAPRIRQLQSQLQDWTEWANQKVMQAARRLSKDKAELKTLMQEKEEMEQIKKEKKILEDNTMKKLTDMEKALRKASGQVERANAAVRKLEFENSVLRQEMEAAKLHAAESAAKLLAASCMEVSKREKKTLMKFQSWDKQKIIFQEELLAEKQKLLQLQQNLQKAKDVLNQAEDKLNQELKAKEEFLKQAVSFKKEKEQIEISTKSKENTVKLKAENNFKKYKDDIAHLEKEISRLRLKKDSSKIAALKRGIYGSYASKVTESKNLKDSSKSYISKMVPSSNGGVKRERECVMCLSEEMSVVFLPCAHQVVCTMCNELHEKQGMKECPSCRSPIQRRVCVRYARS